MIDGVKVHTLQRFYDARGAIFKMLSASDPHFTRFGEVYFSYIKPKTIKGWQLHKLSTLAFAVPTGTITLVLCDKRETSPTNGQHQAFSLGVSGMYSLVVVPPLVWFGYKSASENRGGLIAIVSDNPYDPDDVAHASLAEIKLSDPFDWGKFEVAW